MTKDEALRLSLEALEDAAYAIDSWGSYASGYFQVKHDLENDISKARKAITAIKEALAQSDQEKTVCPFCSSEWVTAEQHDRKVDRLERKPLSDEEIRKAKHHMVEGAYDYSFKQGVKWAEYKHGIKGEA